MIYKTVGSGGDFATLTGVGGFNSWMSTAGNVTDDVTATIISNITEPGLNGMNYAGGYSIYIVPDGTTIRVLQINSTTSNVFNFNGAANITVDGRYGGSGRYLQIQNTATTAGTAATKFQNGACYNTLKYCIIKCNRFAVNFAGTTAAIGSSYNTVDNNIIGPYTTMSVTTWIISCSGTAGLPNSYNTISNNEIVANTSGAINLGSNAGPYWSIIGNSIYASATISTLGPIQIYINDASGYGYVVEHNYIGGTAAYCGGSAMTLGAVAFNAWVAIRSNHSASSANPISSISFNTVSNIANPAATGNAGTIVGIWADTSFANIIGNTVSYFSLSGYFTFMGIRKTSDLIERNTVNNMTLVGGVAGSPSFHSFYCGGTIRHNTVHSFTVGATITPTINGISAITPGSIINNMVSLVSSTGARINGIYVSNNNVAASYVYCNSVYLTGPAPSSGYSSYAFQISTATVVTLKNNIFTNAITGGSASGQYSIMFPATGTYVSNYNALISVNYSTKMGKQTTDKTFAQWQALGYDTNSVNVAIVPISTSDLHLSPGSNGTIETAGTTLSEVINDIDYQLRPTTSPDIGADQRNNIVFDKSIPNSWNI